MKRFFYIACMMLLFSCTQEDIDQPSYAVVKISGLFLEDFNNQSPDSRIANFSEWLHVFPDEATLVLTNNQTGESFTIGYDPNNFGQSYQLSVPVGSYSYLSEVEGADISPYLPFMASGTLEIGDQGAELILDAETDYGLITLNSNDFERAEFSGGDGFVDFSVRPGRNAHYLYVRNGLEGIVRALNSEAEIETEVSIGRYQHAHFIPSVSSGNLNVIGIELGEFSLEEHPIAMGGEQLRYVKDIEGNIYKVVKIGNQYWMAENLRNSTYCNGDRIEYLEAGNDWLNLREGVYGYYFDDPTLVKPYGYYYNSVAALDERNICPCGWKVPSRGDFEELIQYVGGEDVASEKLRRRGVEHWRPFNDNAEDAYGFSAVAGGVIIVGLTEYTSGSEFFYWWHEQSLLWTTTFASNYTHYGIESPFFTAHRLVKFTLFQNSQFGNVIFSRTESSEIMGVPIRCIKE